MAASKSTLLVIIGIRTIVRPSFPAERSIRFSSSVQLSSIALSINVPTIFRPGTISASSCMRLPIRSAFAVVTPVMCLPGLASEFAYCTITGSVTVAITVGTSRLAYQAASAIGFAGANMTSIFASTSSRASARSLRASPSAERLIRTRFPPSTYPASRSPLRKPRVVTSE